MNIGVKKQDNKLVAQRIAKGYSFVHSSVKLNWRGMSDKCQLLCDAGGSNSKRTERKAIKKRTEMIGFFAKLLN